jgi:hypothetical protein
MGGIEFDEVEARRWIVAASRGGPGVATDRETGVFADRVSLLDFDPGDLDRLRALAELTRLERADGVESAIAIAGSAAQGRVQLFPGDNDFFERVHIHAGTQRDAERTLRDLVRATALRALGQPDIVLTVVNFGTHAGESLAWTTADLLAATVTVTAADGSTHTIAWDDTDVGGGWVYLEWIVADRGEGRLAQASNMVDATWEDPTGAVHSLDGAVDPLCQEVYLEASALPLVARLDDHVADDARGAYLASMRAQAFQYTQLEPNYGKAAKRLYNLFRLTDELEAAAYIRELFDEPGARLYQVPTLLHAADVAADPESGIDRAAVRRQIDAVVTSVRAALDGPDEEELVAALADLDRIEADGAATGEAWDVVLARVNQRCAAIVNEFFRTRLLAMPRIEAFVSGLTEPA